MQSLGLKMVPGVAPCGRRRRRPWAGQCGRDTERPFRVAACSSSEPPSDPDSDPARDGSGEASSGGSFLTRSQKYALLKQQLTVAAKFENYKEAARIRDSLKSFEEEEPVLRLRRLMKKAVEEERFEDAARYRDELKAVAPHSLLKCSSDATTLGIRVQVRSVYIEGRSQPLKGQYLFAYRIRIMNNSQRPVQLLRRHWIITDANGKTENAWGIGVVGEQPVILPNTGFEYSSACPLTTASGRMSNNPTKDGNRSSSQQGGWHLARTGCRLAVAVSQSQPWRRHAAGATRRRRRTAAPTGSHRQGWLSSSPSQQQQKPVASSPQQ